MRNDVDVCRYSASGEMRFDVDVYRYSASGEMRALTSPHSPFFLTRPNPPHPPPTSPPPEPTDPAAST